MAGSSALAAQDIVTVLFTLDKPTTLHRPIPLLNGTAKPNTPAPDCTQAGDRIPLPKVTKTCAARAKKSPMRIGHRSVNPCRAYSRSASANLAAHQRHPE